MNTPICDYVREYASRQPVRMHMPGHKGRGDAESLDITEITGADVLYHPTGIILESERNAARLFGARRTVYSAEGSSLCIRAMVALAAQYAMQRGKKPRIIAARNAHKVFITAAALLDVQVDWLWPEEGESLLSCSVSPKRLDAYLSGGEAPAAVYLTSPDYLGNMANIEVLSKVCRSHGCLLLVDNAHGAYLRFLPGEKHPMAQGADLCCDSAHKTLPVLTGGAYLHISRHAPPEFDSMADGAMALFASTSPSYLILQSLDAANAAVSGAWRQTLEHAEAGWTLVKEKLLHLGFQLVGQEPMKLTIAPKPYGYTGNALQQILEAENIYCEFADPDYLVLMLPAEYEQSLPGKLLSVLERIPRKPEIMQGPPAIGRAEAILTPHEAIFRPNCRLNVGEALGRVMADPTVSCPPAIPIVCCGERIEEWAIEAMEYYGIRDVTVIA